MALVRAILPFERAVSTPGDSPNWGCVNWHLVEVIP